MGSAPTMTTEQDVAPAAAAPAKKKFQPKKLSEEDSLLKDIKIKTGICKRCTKELGMYKTENAKLQAVVDKLVEDGACSHDINKQKEVLEENVNIIPSTISRLQEAYENLFMLDDENEENAKINQAEEFLAAREVIKAAEACEEVVQ